jgi:hypothetical protein
MRAVMEVFSMVMDPLARTAISDDNDVADDIAVVTPVISLVHPVTPALT